MICTGCENRDAYRLSYSASGERCNACAPSEMSSFRFSDVYFKGAGVEENLSHPEKSPQGIFVRSREHKAAVMRGLGLREVGDKIRGARVSYK